MDRLYNTLSATAPGLLGGVAVGLAAVYLAAGLGVLHQRPDDSGQARVLLALAAMFVTLAIPVQLGLHGITLGWALEGVVLLALGRRFESRGPGSAPTACWASRSSACWCATCRSTPARSCRS